MKDRLYIETGPRHLATNRSFHDEPHSCYLSAHYSDVIMSTMASQITGVTIVYSTVRSGADQWKHESFASLAFVRGTHRWPVNSPHKWPAENVSIWWRHHGRRKTKCQPFYGSRRFVNFPHFMWDVAIQDLIRLWTIYFCCPWNLGWSAPAVTRRGITVM